MARKDEREKAIKELFQYLRAAHVKYRDQWKNLDREAREKCLNRRHLYQAIRIATDMCKLFQLYAPGKGIVNDDPRKMQTLVEEVVGAIAGCEKFWGRKGKKYKDFKAKYHNDYDVFIGVTLSDYFTKNYDLTSRWDRGVKTIFIRDKGSSSRF